MDSIKALFTKDPPVSDSLYDKAADRMFTYLISKFQQADAAHPPQVIIDRVGAEFQTLPTLLQIRSSRQLRRHSKILLLVEATERQYR